MGATVQKIKENVEAFGLFIGILLEGGKITQKQFDQLSSEIDNDLALWCLRARCYHDWNFKRDMLFDETGAWDDEAIFEMTAPKKPVRVFGSGKLVLNLLLSAKVAKFCEIKPPQLQKVASLGNWDGTEHAWFSNWRCEEAFGMKGTKEKVFIVTNERTRYSVLIRIPGRNSKKLLMAVHSAIMRTFDAHQVPRPTEVELQIRTLSGAARSLASCQNQMLFYLDGQLERGNYEFLDDLERPLNHMLTTIGGAYEFPDRVFAALCKEEPPFGSGAEDGLPAPFLN